jgi:hypothetical protein
MELNIVFSSDHHFKLFISYDFYVINIKREIRKKLGLDFDNIKYMKLIKTSGNIVLNDDWIVGDHLKNQDYVSIGWRFLAGPVLEKTEEIFIKISIEGYDEMPMFSNKFNPAQKINDIIICVLEKMYDHKEHNYLDSNIQVIHDHKYLNRHYYLAHYKNISRSFIQFNNQENIIKTDSLKSKLLANDSYYHNIIIGKKIIEPVILTIIKKQNNTEDKYDISCVVCKSENMYHLILPCCRTNCCSKCEGKMIESGRCINCNTKLFEA